MVVVYFLLFLILYNSPVSVTELFTKDRKYDDLLLYWTCRGILGSLKIYF